MADFWQVVFFSLVGGILSLVGGVFLVNNRRAATTLINYIMPFAAGALLGAAFFGLLPEAIEQTAEGAASRWVLAGIVLFFLLEHFLHWFHHHTGHVDDHIVSAAPLIVIGDTLHNFIDGVAIGAAFLLNAPTGMVTALAVAAHEIPQEIGDFGLLLKAGYSKRKVLAINALSALATTLGAVLVFSLGSQMELPIGELLAVTAGLFIYIAASDLIPAIHAESRLRFGPLSAALLILGILVVGVATETAHEYIDTHTGNEATIPSEHHHD